MGMNSAEAKIMDGEKIMEALQHDFWVDGMDPELMAFELDLNTALPEEVGRAVLAKYEAYREGA